MNKPEVQHGLIVLILLLACVLLFAAWQIDLPHRWGGFRGDSAVYTMMADSLAHDFDLRYTREDLVRITREWPTGPQGVLLVADDQRADIIHYAKPILYPLLAAPLSYFFGVNGLLILNALGFLIILLIGFHSFSDESESYTLSADSRNPILWTLVFWGLSAVPAYIFAPIPDLFNSIFTMIALYPWVTQEKLQPAHRQPIPLLLSCLLLGLIAATRPPNGLFILLPGWSFFERSIARGNQNPILQRLRKLLPTLIAVLLFVIGALLIFKLTSLMTGQAVAHGGFRKRIVGRFPFEAPGLNFLNTGNTISTRTTKFVFHWNTLFHNIRYFFIGRFTGLIIYFLPAAASLLLAWPLRKSSDSERFPGGRPIVWLVLTGLIIFHLVYIPSNYHGGSCAVGNRYLVSFLPAFFFLLRRPPKRNTVFAIAGLTALLSGPIAFNPINSMAQYQHVSKRDIFTHFPPEITLLNSWPVDDSRHVRVPFEGFFIYFADDNQFGEELDGFWTRGDSTATAVLRCWEPVEKFTLKLHNGGATNKIHGHLGTANFYSRSVPGELKTFSLDPGKAIIFYNLAGDPSYCYELTISNANGFVPRFAEPESTDGRYLGSFVRIEIDS